MTEIDTNFKGLDVTKMSGFSLYSTYFSWKQHIESVLLKYDLTNTQFVILITISFLKEKTVDISQTNLANFLNFDANMTSQVLRVLEKNGLINRYQKLGNERTKFLKVTEKGIKKINIASQDFLNAEQNFFGLLGKNKEDFNYSLLTLLGKAQGKSDE